MQRTAMKDSYYVPGAPLTVASLWDALCNRTSKAVCRMFHGEVSLPVCGKYHCTKCLREFDSSW